jgi:hypothetical protein
MRKPLKPNVAFSEAEKARVTSACQRLIDDFLKPRFLPSVQPTQFNYPADILGRWHGAKYRFIQRYRSGFRDNLGEEFDAPFARLDWISPDRFDIQWHRHTGERFRLHRGLTLEKAVETLRSDGILHPVWTDPIATSSPPPTELRTKAPPSGSLMKTACRNSGSSVQPNSASCRANV